MSPGGTLRHCHKLPILSLKSYLTCAFLKTCLPCTILKTYIPPYLPTYLEASSNTTYLPTLKHPQTLPTYLPWSILGSYIPTYLFRPQQILFCGDDCFARFRTSRAIEVFPSPTSSLPIDRPIHQSRLSLGTAIFLEHQSLPGIDWSSPIQKKEERRFLYPQILHLLQEFRRLYCMWRIS
jgi:hypothetical protein